MISTSDTLNETQENVLELANCVAFDVLATRTGADALRGLASAARVLTGARFAAIGVARPGAAQWSEFVTVGLSPETEALLSLRGPLSEGLKSLLEEAETPLSSFLSIPIRRGEVVLGWLYLGHEPKGEPNGAAFSGADEIAMHALCAHAAVAIYHLEMVSQQRSLVRGLMMAQEEERRAVAYDLHDGLTQYVMASHAYLEAFQAAQKGGKVEKAARDLEQGLKLLKDAVTESRRLVNGLRLLALDDLGLAGALEQLVREERARAGWDDANFIHNLFGRRFDEALETAIYRVAQEALTNARRHAETAQVRVILLEEAACETDSPSGAPTGAPSGMRLRLEVRDWGCGFDAQAGTGSGHCGLHGLIERIHLMEGTCEIRSVLGEGTTICASFPATPPAPKAETEASATPISLAGANL